MEINWKQTSDKELTRSYNAQEVFMNRLQEDHIKAINKYDEEFLASLGIHKKENGRYDPKELKEFHDKYERKYFNTTERMDINSVVMRSSYSWQKREWIND